jgi:SAM-dependent methyltransferase
MSTSRRSRVIDEVIDDLERLKRRLPKDYGYALDANVGFFNAARTHRGLLRWQLFVAPKLEAGRLLELADFPLVEWQRKLYSDLRWIERKSFPGLLTPLVRYLVESGGATFLDLGCGAMEVERHTILALQHSSSRHERRAAFVGVDTSSIAFDMISQTFDGMNDFVDIRSVDTLDSDLIARLAYTDPPFQVIFLQADAQSVASADLDGFRFDIAFSAKFKHHLDESTSAVVDASALELSHTAIEYDDFRSRLSWIPLYLTAWSRPVLLNAALFSRLRQPTKRSIDVSTRFSKVTFHTPPGTYIGQIKEK